MKVEAAKIAATFRNSAFRPSKPDQSVWAEPRALEEDRLKALEAGADDFDTKPVDLKRLISKIEALAPSDV